MFRDGNAFRARPACREHLDCGSVRRYPYYDSISTQGEASQKWWTDQI